jgi:hypothetical protein
MPVNKFVKIGHSHFLSAHHPGLRCCVYPLESGVTKRLNDTGTWQQIELAGSSLQHAAVVEDLKPATKYTFRVVAEGPAGLSEPSPELTVRTEPQRPAGPPLSVSLRPVSSMELLVTWSPPLAELRHGDIQGYNVGYREIR